MKVEFGEPEEVFVSHAGNVYRCHVCETWRPIATAPKDGSWFMAVEVAHNGYRGIDLFRWDERTFYADPPSGWQRARCSRLYDKPHITHWLPLPEIPLVEGGVDVSASR